jgi:hypothetical protein
MLWKQNKILREHISILWEQNIFLVETIFFFSHVLNQPPPIVNILFPERNRNVKVLQKSSTAGATSEAGTTYHSRAPEFTLGFSAWSSCY